MSDVGMQSQKVGIQGCQASTQALSVLILQVGCVRVTSQLVINSWEFPKVRSTLFWGPYNNDPTI